MTRLDELIQELCPNGVKYLTIPELFITRNGYTPSKANAEFWENGTIPWFRMEDIRENGRILTKSTQYVSEKAIKGKLFPEDSIIIATSATIGEHALVKVPSLANQRFTYLVLKDEFKSSVDMMFIFYYCFKLDEFCKTHLNQGNFASVDMKQFAEFKFPVPPLPVQREIVRILDNFTELTARRKQYEYYRDELFNFKCTKIVLIPEIADVFIGLVTTMTSHYVPVGIPLIFNSCIKENRFIFEKQIYLDEEFANKNNSRRHKVGDVITVHTGDVGTSAIIGKDLDGSLGFATIVSRIKNLKQINPQYLCYYLNSNTCKKQIATMIKGDRDNLNLKDFKKIKIPIPSLEEQTRIISILNRFDALCNDLTSGLPAEIEARQKQYEYYRDKLLTISKRRKYDGSNNACENYFRLHT